MISKESTGQDGRVRVTFRLPANTWADRISVVGEFNDWDTTATPMTHLRADADWQATVDLEAGRRYRFRYLLDGREWLSDWYADDFYHEEGPCRSCDSVVDLTGFVALPLS